MSHPQKAAPALLRLGPLRLPRGSQPLVLMLCGSAVLLFLMLTEEMREGETHALDTAILLAMRRAGNTAVPAGPSWLPQSAVDMSALGGFTALWLLTLSAVGFLLIARRRTDALLLAASIGGASILNAALKAFLDRARPEVISHLVEVSNASYPSGHAMLSATTYLTMGALAAHTQTSRTARIYLLALSVLLTILIGLSRLYLGVHWPSDVLAGWSLGAAWALAVWVLAQRLRGDTARPEGA